MVRHVDDAVGAWRKQGVRLCGGSTEAAILAAFASMDRVPSSDVIALYSRCDGMADGDSDRSLFSLWPLEKMAAEYSRFEAQFVPFGDWLISSHEYCFRYNSPQRSAVFSSASGELRQVASDVEEFLVFLLSDPDRVDAWLNDRGA